MLLERFSLHRAKLWLACAPILLLCAFPVFAFTEGGIVGDPQAGITKFYQEREIETPLKLWLNGYLGLFFRFKWVGVLNWLAIPLIFLILWRGRRQEWARPALLAIYLLSFLLIAAYGYFNGRYALTLGPFTITAVLILGSELARTWKPPLPTAAFFIVAAMIFSNIYAFRADYLGFVNAIHRKEADLLPVSILNFINALAEDPPGIFLVYNAPAFYYYTCKKGYNYVPPFPLVQPGLMTETGVDNIFAEAGVRLFGDPDPQAPIGSPPEKAYERLRDGYGVRYVFIGALPGEVSNLHTLIRNGCELIQAENGYALYRLKNRYSVE